MSPLSQVYDFLYTVEWYMLKSQLKNYPYIKGPHIIKTHGSESRNQEEAGLCDEPVKYLQVALL